MSEDLRLEKVPAKRAEQRDSNLELVFMQCCDEIFDWLTLSDVAALNLTCKKFQLLSAEYFERKYQTKVAKLVQNNDIGDILYRSADPLVQQFTPNIRSLVMLPNERVLSFLQSQNTKDLVSIAFYDGEINESDGRNLAELLRNVEIIEIQYTWIDTQLHECVLQYCRQIKQLVIKYGLGECKNAGIEYQWTLMKYPTLEHFHWSTASLPTNLDVFFRQNPNVRSFHCGAYTTSDTLEYLIKTGISVNELHLELITELCEDEREGLAVIRSQLNVLYGRRQFKSCMLQFVFCSQMLDREWASVKYLHGAYVDFPGQAGSTKALAALVSLRVLVLGVKTILSRGKANILSTHLVNLEEIYAQTNSVHAITPFLKNCPKLSKIYIYQTGSKNEFNAIIYTHHISSLNADRSKLTDACKTTVYLPDEAYAKIKWSSPCLTFSLIEVKRSESHVVRHPFAATKLRRDICELCERF